MAPVRPRAVQVVLLLAAVSLLAVACGRGATPTPTATATPGASFPESLVRVDLRPIETPADRWSFGVVVYVDPRGQGLSGIEVPVTYDPAVLEADPPSRGTLLGEDAADASRVDPSGGAVRVAIARLGATNGPTPAGALATLRFRFRSGPGPVPTNGSTRLGIGQVLALDGQVRPLPVADGGPFDWKSIAEAYNRGE